jgi:hypothetical protein
MMEAVHQYEGIVMGDGIMAIFGAPLAHEDHAVSACYAALRMQALAGGRGAYRLARQLETTQVPPTVQAVLAYAHRSAAPHGQASLAGGRDPWQGTGSEAPTLRRINGWQKMLAMLSQPATHLARGRSRQ